VESFIAQHGVTQCPGMFTPELAEHNFKRSEEWKNMSWAQKRRAISGQHWKGRKNG
jgi:hypothetical protein